MLSALHKQLLNNYQRDFPLSPQPYRDIARSLGVSEEDVLNALTELMENRYISRIGPIIPPNHIGVSTLAAMAVPDDRLAVVADIVNRCPEVNHNYEREHVFNLWFVLIASDQGHLQSVVSGIERKTGLQVMQLPLLADYFIDLGFSLDLDD
ncbi:MAG: Lrp/AsnC family transcriptional regulator [Gammaproteobacteria bacterium]